MGLYCVPKESFIIEIVADALGLMNVNKIKSEMIVIQNLLSKLTAKSKQIGWVWTTCAVAAR